ncbi:AGE family epimerase/isomerase [Saccharicrinis sp. 156]|uniref:AGE family epimerase/isomerase n=1 Tax=Saccharicrinis sp. 156 TaxID=3417574 RepID=UPI003D326CA4
MEVTKKRIIKSEIFELAKEMEAELQRLLDFWIKETLDPENGGFIGRIDHFGNKYPKAIKGVVLNARILWTFASAYRITKQENYKEVADLAFHYLINKFWDKKEGGFFWAVDYRGNVTSERKQTYAQGFGIYALAEYNRATGNTQALEYARQLYYIIESKYWDKAHDGYIEALNKDWSCLEDMRLSDKDANLPKSMNTHLHILEPYANLYRIWPDRQLKESIKSLIGIFQNKIIDAETGHYNLFFDMNWSAKSHGISFGHDIEGAWLMHEAAEVTGDPGVIESVRETALNLVDITLREGLDEDGSLFNEKDGDHLDSDKHWWPQAEAMVGLFDAWEISGNNDYLSAIDKLWIFIKNMLVDTVNGEWYWSVDKKGVPHTQEDKVGFWKCPYHNCRALMEIIERLNKYKIDMK